MVANVIYSFAFCKYLSNLLSTFAIRTDDDG
jgi:hypothetical protein